MKALRLALVASSIALVSTSVNAQYVIGSQAITASAGLPDGYASPTSLNSLINQSGLGANYVSGVTNFAGFVSTTTAYYSCDVQCLSELGGVAGFPAWIKFDLGQVMNITRIAVWNQTGSASLSSFNLVSDDGALGTFNMQLSGSNGGLADVFSFAATNTRYITMNILSNEGYEEGTILNEVAFEGGAAATVVTPEPSSMVLTLAGMIVVVGVARRRGTRSSR